VGRLVGAPILLWATVAGGLVGLIWSLLAVHWSGGWLLLVPFLALAAAAECLKVEVYQAKQERLSLSFTIAVTMAAATVLPASAPLVSGLAALVHMILRRQRRLDKALFGVANPVLAAMAASTVYELLRPLEPALTVGHLGAALVAVASFYLVNIGLIVLMISLHTGRPLARVMRETAWFGPTNLALGLTGAFVGETHELLGLTGVVMFIVPLLVMRFTLALYARQSQQTIAALELARAEAEAAAHAREEFLSVASHELKTPLTTVKGYVQMLARALQQPVVEREHIARYAGYLQAQVARLEGLVADLLDSSRIQQGRLDLHPEPADLAALARHVLARFEHAAERLPTHRLMCDAPEPLLGTWDTTRLDQVLTNLISNALKYSPNGGEVGVRVRQVGDLAEVVVSDQGVGIPADARATLFRPFARGNATARNIPGAGLGLYIAARITERHGGSITVQSEPGVGSTFTVRLPLAPPAA
jgi:signal transduction histidine kinase